MCVCVCVYVYAYACVCVCVCVYLLPQPIALSSITRIKFSFHGCGKFSNVSALVSFQYKHIVELTFENFYFYLAPFSKVRFRVESLPFERP